MLVLYGNTYMSDGNTVHALNSLDIAMPCSKQTGWYAADDRTLITTNYYTIITLGLTWTGAERLET